MKNTSNALRRVMSVVLVFAMMFTSMPTGALAEDVVDPAPSTTAAEPASSETTEPTTPEPASSEAAPSTEPASSEAASSTEPASSEAAPSTEPASSEAASSTEPASSEAASSSEPASSETAVQPYTLYVTHVLNTDIGTFADQNVAVALSEKDFAEGIYDAAALAYQRTGIQLVESARVSLDDFVNGEAYVRLTYQVAEGYKAVRKSAAGGASGMLRARAIYVGSFDDVEVVPVGQKAVRLTFVDEDGVTALPSETIMVDEKDGAYPFSYTVALPAGYTMTISDPDFAVAADGKTITGMLGEADRYELTVTFTAGMVDYTVVHKYPNLDGTYTEEAETKSGKYGALTEAVEKAKEGFTVQPVEQKLLDGDAVTVEVLYERNTYNLTYNTNGGSYVPGKSGKYEETVVVHDIVTVPGTEEQICGYTYEHTHSDACCEYGGTGMFHWRHNDSCCKLGLKEHTHTSACYKQNPDTTTGGPLPTRQGYTFDGWYLDAECTQPAETTVVMTEDKTVYAKWTAQDVNYTVVYMKQVWDNSANAAHYVYDSSVVRSAKAGETVTAAGTGKSIANCTFVNGTSASVKADGSTVVYAYYDLIKYTIVFDLDDSNAKIEINGSTYTGKNYKIEDVVIGQDISTLWPVDENISTTSTTGGRNPKPYIFDTWGSSYKTKRFELTADLVSDANAGNDYTVTYKAQWTTNSYNRRVEYWLENADGTGYAIEARYSQNVNSNNLSAKTIYGYTKINTPSGYQGSGEENGQYVYRFYYNRTKYSIEYRYNDTVLETKTNIRFGSSINSSQYNYTPERPAGLDSEYTFAGWYDNAELAGDPYSFTTMPGSNLVLYAKWAAPEKTVTLVYNDGTENSSVTVKKGETAQIPTPQREGYTFKGWYADEAGTTPFDVNAPIVSDTTIYAKWEANRNTTYTVRYIYTDADGAVHDVAPSVTRNGIVGSTVLEKAVAAAGEYAGYAVDALSKSLTLQPAASQNVITFVYTSLADMQYTVQYVYNGTALHTTAPIAAEAQSFTVTADENVLNSLLQANGVELPEADRSQRVTLTPGGENIVTFTLVDAGFTITYHGLEGSTGAENNPTSYTVNSDDITLANPSKTGYEFLGWTTTASSDGAHVGADKEVVIQKGSRGNLEFTATWQLCTYTLTTVADANSVIDAGGSYSYDTQAATTVNFSANRGYKIATVTVDGTALAGDALAAALEAGSVTVDHTGNHRVEVTAEVDASQTQSTSYAVKYTIEGVEQAADTLTVTGTAWVNDDPAQIAIAEGGIPAPADKYVGYKLDEANPEYPAAGTLVNSGAEYVVNYVKDDSQKQDTSYTVKYTIEGVEQAADTLTVTGTAWVNDDPAQIAIAEGGIPAPADKYVGYKLDEANPEYPAAGTLVNSGAEYVVNYVIDETQTKTLRYTVNYFKDGEFAEGIPVEQTVQVLQPDTLTVQLVDTSADRYEGFTFDYTSPAEIPAVIAHEGEINVYYATDEKGGEDGPDGIPDYAQIVFTYQSADVQKGTVDKSVEIHTFERLNGELLEEKKASPAGANAAGREGYAFDYWTDGTKRDVTSGMETLKSEVYTDNAEFTAYFDVDTKGTDPENPDKPDNVPDKYQAKVTYQAVNGAVTLGGSTGTELVTYVTLFDADGKWAENGTGKLAEAQVPTAAAAADYDPATERWTPAVPAEGAEITADGAVFTVTWELAISGYQVHYYYDGVEDTASAVNATGKIGDAIPYDTGKTTFDGANYVLENVDGAGKLISKDAAANIVNVNFTKDEKSDPTKDPDPEVPGDNIPDKYQATVTFEAINGVLQPKGGTDAQNTKQMTTVVTLLNGNGEPAENGTGYLTEAQIPTALANLGYIANTLFWGPATPTTSYAITGDITFVADFNAEGVIPEEPPVPPVTPVGPTAPEEGPEETIDEPETPLAPAEPEAPAEEPAEEEIEEADTPLASGAAWALLNLILMLCTALVSILLLIGFLGKKKKEDENENVEYTVKRKGVTRVLSLIPAIGSIIAFLLTENMRNPMVFVDRWTWLMVLIALVQVIVCIFARKEKEEPDDNAQTPAQA